jgi:NADPH:quinone reductase-like Zn-dependent oxidoreductase
MDCAQVESIGEGVTSVQVGDHVVPLYTAGMRTPLFTHFLVSDNITQNAESASSACPERRTSVARVLHLSMSP